MIFLKVPLLFDTSFKSIIDTNVCVSLQKFESVADAYTDTFLFFTFIIHCGSKKLDPCHVF